MILNRLTHAQFLGIVTQIDYHNDTEENYCTLKIETHDKTYVAGVDAINNPNLEKGDYVRVQYRRGLHTRAPNSLLIKLGLSTTVEDSKYKPGVILICPEPKIKKLTREDVKKPWDKLSLSVALAKYLDICGYGS